MRDSDSHALARLAERAAGGDRSAVDELVGALRPQIVRAVRLVVGAGSWAAEDAAQEALIDVIRGIKNLRQPELVKAWALRVAMTRALKVARRERIRSLGRPLTEADELAAAPADDRALDLKRAFDTLPARMRAVAVLRLYAGLSEQETATTLDCSLGTVKSQLYDARVRLARALRAGDDPPVVVTPQLPTQIGGE